MYNILSRVFLGAALLTIISAYFFRFIQLFSFLSSSLPHLECSLNRPNETMQLFLLTLRTFQTVPAGFECFISLLCASSPTFTQKVC